MEFNDDYQVIYLYNLRDIYQQGEQPYLEYLKIRDGMKPSSLSFLTELDDSDITKLLVQPLISRWSRDNIYLFKSKIKMDWSSNATRDIALAPIWQKLNDILGRYKKALVPYQKMVDKETFETIAESTSSNENRVNDTPTSYGDYSADNYASNVSKGTSSGKSKSSSNEYETYDVISQRVRSFAREIIEEMRSFEIYG